MNSSNFSNNTVIWKFFSYKLMCSVRNWQVLNGLNAKLCSLEISQTSNWRLKLFGIYTELRYLRKYYSILIWKLSYEKGGDFFWRKSFWAELGWNSLKKINKNKEFTQIILWWINWCLINDVNLFKWKIDVQIFLCDKFW